MEHLKEVFRRLDPARPLDWDLLRTCYVNRPGDPVGKLVQILDLSETPQHILLVGQRGVGKTTELRRLARSLASPSLPVLCTLDHESISDPTRAITQLAGALESTAQQHQVGDYPETEDLSNLPLHWQSFAGAVRRARTWGQPPVFLIDGLEKRQGRSIEPVARLVTTLRQIDCSIVLVVPLSMVLLPDTSSAVAEWDRVVILPAISLSHRDGTPDQAGRELLMEVIARRDTFGIIDQDARETLVQFSAGIHRSLLTLAQDACLNAMAANTSEVGRGAVEDAAAERGLEMNGFLTPRFLDALARVRDTKLVGNFNEALPLLERNSIVAYQNSSPWYDVNPLVRPSLTAFSGRGNPA
ncbi:MAG: ATP-binding protein [Isosphaeraceae bacterium]